MKFPCSSCGACCRQVDKVVEAIANSKNKDNLKEIFPYDFDESGKCEKLLDDNTCAVYDDRPFICSVDNLNSLVDISKDEFYQMNVDYCNALMDEQKIDLKFRISLDYEKE